MQPIKYRNNVTILGKGKQTIVFGHGLGCDQTIWKYITPPFEEKYQIVLFDYVGSGNSDLSAYESDRYKDLNGYAMDLLEIIEALALKDVIFIGHSVSSMIGTLASIQQPEVFKCLIMIAPSPRYINDINYIGGFNEEDVKELLTMMEMNFVGWASVTAPLAMNNPQNPKLGQDLQSRFCSGDPIITREFAQATFLSDHRNDLSQISVPTLIIQCSEDSMVPKEVGEYLHQHIQNSTLLLTEAKGHYPQLSDPTETVAIIQNYLAQF